MAEALSSAFLAHAMSGLMAGSNTVGIGANSPIPAAAALLAQRHDPGMRVTILGSPRHNPYTNGGAELFDFAAEGRLETFVLGALQIDGDANLNLVSVGDYQAPKVRYPGSFGSGLLYYVVPRVIVFREDHSARALVERVDFISATGSSPPGVHRPGGPAWLLTGKAIFRFDRSRARFVLTSLHPGVSEEEVRANTGFVFECDVVDAVEPASAVLAPSSRVEAPRIAVTPSPARRELDWLAGPIADELSDLYPAFAVRLRAAAGDLR